MATVGTVEIDLSGGGWGGDFSLTANGDLLLAQDSLLTPSATFERINRLILTNAAVSDANDTPISEADDLFNPSYGSSARAFIGEPPTSALLSSVQAAVQAGLATEPGIVSSPAPTVSVTNGGSGKMLINVEVTLLNGSRQALPTVAIQAA